MTVRGNSSTVLWGLVMYVILLLFVLLPWMIKHLPEDSAVPDRPTVNRR